MEKKKREARRAERERRDSLVVENQKAQSEAEEELKTSSKTKSKKEEKEHVQGQSTLQETTEVETKTTSKRKKNKKKNKVVRVPSGVRSMFKQQAAHDMAVALETVASKMREVLSKQRARIIDMFLDCRLSNDRGKISVRGE